MFRKSFCILKNNMIFIQPLLLFILILMTAVSFLVNKHLFWLPKTLLIISMIILFVAFSAGWFFINKFAIFSYEENDTKEEIASKAISSFKKFFEGIGRNFVKTFLGYLVLFVIYGGVLFLLAKLCMLTFGEPKIIYDIPKIMKATSQAEILNFVNSYTIQEKIAFSSWILVFNFATAILNFFIILYFAAFNFGYDEVFEALVEAVRFFFKNILTVIAILISVFVLYIGLNVLSLLLGTNPFSFVILIILFTIYLNYYVILLFYTYYDKLQNIEPNRPE
jgi:hypothetical protein